MKTKLIRIVLAVVLFAGYYVYENHWRSSIDTISEFSLREAIESRAQDIQLEGEGIIVKVLPDDTKGSAHQRLLVKVFNNSTVLIAHNIDLAPRVRNPQEGEKIQFFGEYIWNDKGGVMHWTHHDPAGRHVDGWLKYKGEIYQ